MKKFWMTVLLGGFACLVAPDAGSVVMVVERSCACVHPAIPQSTLCRVLEKAAGYWGIPYPVLLKDFEDGECVVEEIKPGQYRVELATGGSTILLLESI